MKHILKLFGIPLFMVKGISIWNFPFWNSPIWNSPIYFGGRKQFTPGDGKAPHPFLPVSIADCRFLALQMDGCKCEANTNSHEIDQIF